MLKTNVKFSVFNNVQKKFQNVFEKPVMYISNIKGNAIFSLSDSLKKRTHAHRRPLHLNVILN